MRRSLAIFVLFLFVPSVQAGPTTQPWLLHLPGIGGHLPLDDHLIRGLHDGGVTGWLEIYDWTGTDRGLIALLQEKRHDEQSTRVATMISEKAQAYPGLHVTLTSHSAGCGIAVWALEKLPDDVVIDDFVMMQSALSPEYDLTKALKHVKRAYAFNSELDVVLSRGTSAAGTVDGVRTEAAGMRGYKMPAEADAKQYEKLTQFQYQESWMRLGNIGDHIGPMNYRFARYMTAKLLQAGKLPDIPPLTPATTQANR